MTHATAILDGLNPPQREAVLAEERFLMVLAGAGSGKTRVLTRRLAHLVHTGAARPEELLAVTFTNKAAKEMRERVAALAGEGAGRFQWVGTFHGMGARMLRRHAQYLGYDSQFLILDSGDQERLIKDLLQELKFDDPVWTPGRVLNAISRWKDDGLGPEHLDQVTTFRNNAERARLSELYQKYQEGLHRLNAMDFGDLLTQCLRLWRQEPGVLAHYQSQFRHILVDEFQDTNHVQFQWMSNLAGGQAHLCVVGDDDQSIYGWRGARLDNILTFEQQFPGTRIIRLEQNYRSTGHILQAASHLISHNSGRMGKTLWTEGGPGAKVEWFSAYDGREEASFVAREVAELCQDGQWERCAVLVRASRQTQPLEEAFIQRAIPYRVVGGMRFMERAEIKDCLGYLRLLYSSRDDLAFNRVVNLPRRGIGTAALEQVAIIARDRYLSLCDAAREVVAQGSLRGRGRQGLAEFIATIDLGRDRLGVDTPDRVLTLVLEHSGYFAWLNSEPEGRDRRENVEEFLALLSRYDSLVQFLEETALVTDMNDGESLGDRHHVVISTLHAAKGLEFPVVFLVGMEEGLLPHQLAINSGDLEEERRLAYVGMTRARDRLYLTHAMQRWMYGGLTQALPSRFLSELPREILRPRKMVMDVRRGIHGRGYR